MGRLKTWWSRTGTTGRLMAAAVLCWPFAMRRPARLVVASYVVAALLVLVLWLVREAVLAHHGVAIRAIYGLAVSLFCAVLVVRIFTRLSLHEPMYWAALVVGTTYLGVDFLILSDRRVRVEAPTPPPDSRRPEGTVH
jgi:hypothetical protein